MPTNQTENYLRLHLLNNEAILVLRATFLKIVEETCDGDVDKFLSEFEQDIKKQLKNKAQLSIIFPANRRTNIEQWDVSLVCFVLVSCCTLEGKMRVDKLRDLMKRQYSAYNDIDKFLSYYKADIEQMKTDNAIDEVQYAKLYPKNLASNLYEWDLNMLLSLLAKFCKGQNKEKFLEIMRSCIMRDVVLYATSPDLTEYLKLKETKCKDIRDKGLIEQGEYNQLFPQEGGISDVNKWNDHLLKVIVLTVCRGLTQNTVDAIKVVKQIRNELIAHKGSAEMETGEFLTTWTKLFNAIEVIVKEEVPKLTQEWTQKCKALNNDPFDITGAISILIEYYSKETSEFNSVRDALQDIQRTIEIGNVQRAEEHKRTQEQLLQLTKSHADLAEAIKNLAGEKKDIHRYTVTIDVESIDVKIHVASANESSKENTEKAIRFSIQSALEGRKTDIKIQTVSKLLEGITKDGSKVENVYSGSILLRIKCLSLKGITQLIVFVGSQELRKTLKEMEKEIDDDVELACDISDESTQSIMKELSRIQKKYDENNPLVCSGMETDNKKTSVQIDHETDDFNTEAELIYFDTVDKPYTTEDNVLTEKDRISDAKEQLEKERTDLETDRIKNDELDIQIRQLEDMLYPSQTTFSSCSDETGYQSRPSLTGRSIVDNTGRTSLEQEERAKKLEKSLMRIDKNELKIDKLKKEQTEQDQLNKDLKDENMKIMMEREKTQTELKMSQYSVDEMHLQVRKEDMEKDNMQKDKQKLAQKLERQNTLLQERKEQLEKERTDLETDRIENDELHTNIRQLEDKNERLLLWRPHTTLSSCSDETGYQSRPSLTGRSIVDMEREKTQTELKMSQYSVDKMHLQVRKEEMTKEIMQKDKQKLAQNFERQNTLLRERGWKEKKTQTELKMSQYSVDKMHLQVREEEMMTKEIMQKEQKLAQKLERQNTLLRETEEELEKECTDLETDRIKNDELHTNIRQLEDKNERLLLWRPQTTLSSCSDETGYQSRPSLTGRSIVDMEREKIQTELKMSQYSVDKMHLQVREEEMMTKEIMQKEQKLAQELERQNTLLRETEKLAQKLERQNTLLREREEQIQRERTDLETDRIYRIKEIEVLKTQILKKQKEQDDLRKSLQVLQKTKSVEKTRSEICVVQ